MTCVKGSFAGSGLRKHREASKQLFAEGSKAFSVASDARHPCRRLFAKTPTSTSPALPECDSEVLFQFFHRANNPCCHKYCTKPCAVERPPQNTGSQQIQQSILMCVVVDAHHDVEVWLLMSCRYCTRHCSRKRCPCNACAEIVNATQRLCRWRGCNAGSAPVISAITRPVCLLTHLCRHADCYKTCELLGQIVSLAAVGNFATVPRQCSCPRARRVEPS